MAFLRRHKLLVSDAVVGDGSAKDISDLHFSYEIKRTIDWKENLAEIKVWNLGEKSRNEMVDQGSQIELWFGYEDEQGKFGIIYSGNVLRVENVKENDGFCSTIYCATARSGELPLYNKTVSASYPKGTLFKDIMETVCEDCGMFLDGQNIGDDLKLINNLVFTGTFRKFLEHLNKILKSIDYSLSIDNNSVGVYPTTAIPTNSAFEILSWETGLMQIQDITSQIDKDMKGQLTKAGLKRKWVAGKCLINPAIKCNSLVQIDTAGKIPSLENANFMVYSLNITGSNYDNECVMDFMMIH